jgi:serine/threonine protein kinase/Flp pilus assembly protein TadD
VNTEETIFAEALSKGAAPQRSAYLDQACAGNAELRRGVEELLLAHDRARGILETSPVGLDVMLETHAASPGVGATVGPYKLLEQIGGGGMGIVYMAEQLRPVRRKVALKIIKPGMDSGQVIARFEAERQALTMMDHPNIAKVLDAGTTDAGRPYFVMELVKGIPITDYCDQARLSTRQRLELFIQVCHAVQHAHQKGVIHRDLKPSNVLVTLHDDKPVPKVIDFGIAKAAGHVLTERTLFTNYAQMLGTPLYMSPEQAQISGLDVDTRSDVYSLGVLLYELLTGTTPFDKQRLREAAYDEMRRIIREEEPPKPSTRISSLGEHCTLISAHRHTDPKKLGQLVRGELDWIVMKALEKERARRYETANGLGRDVERYLRDEAVQACPPTARYRLRKFARKHRVSLTVAAGFVVLLVAATVVSSWQALRAKRAEVLAQSRLETAEAARARAVTEVAKATAISELLREMLSSADPYRAKGADYTVRQLLDDSSIRLKDQLKDQPEVEAAIRSAIGNAYHRVSMTDKAEPHLQRALAIRRALAKDAGSAAQEAFAQSLLDYSWNFYMSNKAKDGEPYAREAVAIYKQCGVHDARILEALSTLQLILNARAANAEAITVAEEALALGRRYFPDGHGELANILHRMADTKIGQGDTATAEVLARQGVAMHQRWHGKDHIETAWSLFILSGLQSRRRDYFESEANLRQALAIFTAQYGESHESVRKVLESLQGVLEARGDQPALAALRADKAARLSKAMELQGDQLNVRAQLAVYLRDAGDIDGAIAQHTVVLAKDPTRFAARLARADCYFRRNDLTRAAEDYSAAIKLKPDQADAWTGRAFCNMNREQWEPAIADFSKAAELAPEVHTNWYHRGHVYMNLAQWDKAAADFSKVLDGWPDDVWARFLRAEAYAQMHRLDEAVADVRRALATGFKDVTAAQNALAGLKTQPRFDPLRENDEFKKLLAALEQSLPALRAAQATQLIEAVEDNPSIAAIQIQLGDFLRDTGDLDGALTRYTEAVARRAREATNTPELRAALAERFSQLAQLLREKQKMEQAVIAYQQAIAAREPLEPNSPPALRLAQSGDYNSLAFTLWPGKRSADAEVAVRKAVELKQALVKEFPENLDYRMHLAHSYLGLGHITWGGKPAESTQAYVDAAEILNQVAADESATERVREWLGRTCWQLGDAWLAIDRIDDAEKIDQLGRETFAALAAAYPANPSYRQNQAYSLRRLSSIAQQAGHVEDAQRRMGDALGLYRALVAEAPESAFYRHEAGGVAEALAFIHAELGQWDQAVADLNTAAKEATAAELPDLWQTLALVQLAMKDEPAYRRTCAALLASPLPKIPDGDAAFRVVWPCVLLPDAGVDAAQVVRVAEQAIADNPNDPDYLLIVGAALYRVGRFEDAAKTLADADAAHAREEAAPTPGIHITTSVSYGRFFLAMAHQRLNHREEAQRWLDKAIQPIASTAPTTQPPTTRQRAVKGPRWNRRLTLQLLQRETEALLAVQENKSPAKS